MVRRNREAKHPWLVRGVLLAGGIALALFVRAQIQDSELRIEQEIQRITLLEDQPLEEIEEEIEFVEPEPEEIVEAESEPDDTNADAMPSMNEMLGLDAAGVAGADAFGLLARRGGRSLLESGDAACAWYETVLNDELSQLLLPILTRHEELRSTAYSVVLRLWLKDDGAVRNFDVSTTGDAALDAELYAALREFDSVSTPPPPELPQPVRIRLTCRT